ncbi:MAG: bifunctional pyr operon transcriptional regulator/uracil phosphoribosyltransferase PyrR [Planctomycetaceae bacterium]|nr:bifunctional pyr operon transcriptional regulator/uracil phosphoribosyltransferase PyrR [Planctomycetaceae bacterium]
MKKILNAVQVQTAVKRLFEAVVDQLPADRPIAVVGIRTRGETLAARIVEFLRAQGRTVEHGVLDITFYRDDLSRSRGAPLVKATEINFDLDNAWTLLVDDVLQTGRSIRAALDALHDFGRPSVVRLAVLIDRGGRELPIAADFVGKTIKAAPQDRVQVRLEENDGEEAVYIIKKD